MPVDRELAYEGLKWVDPKVYRAYLRLRYREITDEEFQKDIEAINDLIHELNWRDGDIYVELINHSDGLNDFYHWLYEKGYFTHHCALDPENWRKWFGDK